MRKYSEKRLSIHDIKVQMELAQDAITASGQLLMPKDTILTENHLFRLNLYQILSVVIKVYEDDLATNTILEATKETKEADDLPTDMAKLKSNKEYERYKLVYEKVSTLISDHFTRIIEGQPLDQQLLLQTTDALMKSVRLKSDLFTYMSHMLSENGHTLVHSVNVSILCNIFGHWLKLSPQAISDLTLAGLIHDIGKMAIDESLLDKPGKLSQEEFQTVKRHARLGYNMVKDLPLKEQVKEAVLLHHERNDGSGYPLGLKGHQIPDYAKIMAIVDIYDAMTSSRSYHKRFSPFKVIQIFEQESFGYLDTKYLYIFLENIAHYYLGETVRLSDQSTGKIVFIHNQSPSRPIIQRSDDMIDLLTESKLSIIELI